MFKNSKIKISNQNKIIFVHLFMSLNIGIWLNYRQTWLLDNFINIESIGKLLSIGLFCSSFMAIVISLFSVKVKIKDILVLTMSTSIIAMIGLLFSYGHSNIFLMKILMLITIICENLFLIGIYPLYATVKKNGKIYERKTIIQNLGKDIGVFIAGLFIGKILFGFVLNSNFCLLLSIIFSLLSLYFLLNIRYEKDKENIIKTKKYLVALKEIFSKKILLLYFLFCFLVNIAWDIVLGLQFILLTNVFAFSESFSSNFLLFLGVISIILAILFLKKVNFKNNFDAFLFKYGLRAILYFIAYFTNNIIFFIIAFAMTIILSRIATKYTDGDFINIASNDLQFMMSNIRFFMVCLGETVGLFMAGYLFDYGVKYLFLIGGIIYIVCVIIGYILCNMYDNKRY